MHAQSKLYGIRVSRFRKEDRGALQVEFALTILTVLVVVFMLIEMSSAIYAYTVLSEAANEGLRYAIVHSSDADLITNTTNKVTGYAGLSLHDMSGLAVVVSTPDGQTPPGRVQVTVTYPYVPYVSFLTSPPTMHTYAEGRMVY